MEQFYTAKEIAKILNLRTITIRRWISSGKLSGISLGREYRVSKKDFEKFLKDRRVKK